MNETHTAKVIAAVVDFLAKPNRSRAKPKKHPSGARKGKHRARKSSVPIKTAVTGDKGLFVKQTR